VAPDRRQKRTLPERLFKAGIVVGILVVILIMLVTTAHKGKGATFAAANRCPTTITDDSVAYHCWSAYPEAFYATGFTMAAYTLSWNVTCGSRSASGKPQAVGKVVHVIVNQFTQPAAYQLMITSDVCKIDVVATRVSGNGSIHLDLFINQNHPFPAHN